MPHEDQKHVSRRALLGAGLAAVAAGRVLAQDQPPAESKQSADEKPVTAARIDGASGPGWVSLGKDDLVNVNCAEDTWSFDDGLIKCTGKPIGVIRSKKVYKNLELVCQWRHLKAAGNSGIFIWASQDSIEKLAAAGKPGLPKGIEVQVLDTAYAERYEKQNKKPADWFTCHGDVFAVGAKMKPFPPLSPNGQRSFPTRQLSRDTGQWNHYYVRAINGEVRLWVNGQEVSGGNECEPSTGYLCLESEGSPIEFRGLRVRELP